MAFNPNDFHEDLCGGSTPLKAAVRALHQALKDARYNGLIYWEPNTDRGYLTRAQRFREIDLILSETADLLL